MVQREDMDAGRSRERERRACGWTREERPCCSRELEQRAVRVWRGEVQRGDVRWPSMRRGRREAVYTDLAAVFERRDHVSPRGKE